MHTAIRGIMVAILTALAACSHDPEPDDGWQDRITYRTLLRSSDPADGSVACLSCIFDYSRGAVVYQHAYGLDTCPSTVPGERELPVKLSVG